MGGVVVAFVIVIGIIGFSGTISIDNISGGAISPAEAPQKTMPLEVELEEKKVMTFKGRCLAADMNDYLTKPHNEQDLYRVLLKWIRYRQ